MSLRVGIAGYGLAGRYFHAPLLKGCGYEVAAVLTSNVTRAAHVLESKAKNFLEQIASLLLEHEPIRIFVGMPMNMSGSKGESADKAERFVQSLKSVTSLPIVLIDERLSTVSAQKKLKEAGVSTRDSKALIDAMAAVAILEQGLLSENLE
jgi:putative Holliday junction resolvase